MAAANKFVYSSTLEIISTAKTQIERKFDPEVVRRLKATAKRDILIGGPNLANHAFKAGLVDQGHLFLILMVVGGRLDKDHSYC